MTVNATNFNVLLVLVFWLRWIQYFSASLVSWLYLETNELLFGEAMTVNYLYLFDQGTLPTLCSSWGTNQRKSFILKCQGLFHRIYEFALKLTKHEHFHHIHLSLCMFTEILFYFSVLEFCLFALLCNILLKAHSHAHLRKNLQFSYVNRTLLAFNNNNSRS